MNHEKIIGGLFFPPPLFGGYNRWSLSLCSHSFWNWYFQRKLVNCFFGWNWPSHSEWDSKIFHSEGEESSGSSGDGSIEVHTQNIINVFNMQAHLLSGTSSCGSL